MDEAEQLREDIFELHSLIDNVVNRGGDRVVVAACEEAIEEALKRLKELGEDDRTP
jgi:hypothetical protein